MSDEQSNSEIIYKYNEIKQKYTIFFQKALELEEELREHRQDISNPIVQQVIPYQLLKAEEDAGE